MLFSCLLEEKVLILPEDFREDQSHSTRAESGLPTLGVTLKLQYLDPKPGQEDMLLNVRVTPASIGFEALTLLKPPPGQVIEAEDSLVGLQMLGPVELYLKHVIFTMGLVPTFLTLIVTFP